MCLSPCAPRPPGVTSSMAVGQHRNQDMTVWQDANATMRSSSFLKSAFTHVHVCVVPCSFIPRVTSRTHRRHQTTELRPPQSPLMPMLHANLPPRPCPQETAFSCPPFENVHA